MRRAYSTDGPHVAVCVDQFSSHGRGVIAGIAKYLETSGPWSLFIDALADSPYSKGRSENWHGEGILTCIEERARAQRLRDSGIPTVELFAYRSDGLLPLVGLDDLDVGRLAAEHLLGRHSQHFAFCGYAHSLWSDRREQGFVATLAKAGCVLTRRLSIQRPRMLAEWEKVQQQLMAWAQELPKPVALLACSDDHAQRILDACRRANLSVPEEVAVVGVGNDKEICRLSNPPLTSVMLDSEKVGYEGAKLLDRLMSGKAKVTDASALFIPPLGVFTRRSSEGTAINDPLIADAVRAIQARACQGLKVEELLGAFRISRSGFYQRFHDVLGRSPHHEILRVQIERVKGLLWQTPLPLKQITEMTGFDNPNYLNVAFKREVGMTPGEFRHHHNGNT